MNTRTRSALVTAAIALTALAGCNTPKDGEIRKIALPANTSFSLTIRPDGSTEAMVTIPEGNPHVGTFVTDSPYLLDDLKDARDNLGRPGAEAWIEVDEDDQILTITNQTTKQ